MTFFWFLGLGADSDVDWIDMRIGRCRARIVRSWLEFGLDVVDVFAPFVSFFGFLGVSVDFTHILWIGSL